MTKKIDSNIGTLDQFTDEIEVTRGSGLYISITGITAGGKYTLQHRLNEEGDTWRDWTTLSGTPISFETFPVNTDSIGDQNVQQKVYFRLYCNATVTGTADIKMRSC